MRNFAFNFHFFVTFFFSIGKTIESLIISLDVGGIDASKHIYDQIKTNKKMKCFNKKDVFCISKDMKRAVGYIAFDYEKELEMKHEKHVEYILPDGKSIYVGNERFGSDEVLFDWSYTCNNGTYKGIPGAFNDSITSCDKNIRDSLYNNIVLCDGNTLYNGMGKRMAAEMIKNMPKNFEAYVISTKKRSYLAWLGGSLFSQSNDVQNCMVNKQDYDEFGSYKIIQLKQNGTSIRYSKV